MKINLFINDNLNNSSLVNFCKQSKKFKFVFQNLSTIKSFHNQRTLIILKENFLINDFNKKFKKNISFFSKNICFFLSKKYNKKDLNINANVINFPIRFTDFEDLLQNVFKTKRKKFKNLELRNDSYLFNTDNNKITHLTEIESQIILILFKNKTVKKNSLNSTVLKQSPLINSKSLDSHLYRLRKKLTSIDHARQIILVKNQSLIIV